MDDPGPVANEVTRARLETWMDAIEVELARSGELAGFLTMHPDVPRGRVVLTADAPVPALLAWAVETLPPGALDVRLI